MVVWYSGSPTHESLFAHWMLIFQLPLWLTGVVLQSPQLSYLLTHAPCWAHLQAQPPPHSLQPPYLRQACPWIAPLTLSLSVSLSFANPLHHTSNTRGYTAVLMNTHERHGRGMRSVGLLKHKEPLEEHWLVYTALNYLYLITGFSGDWLV